MDIAVIGTGSIGRRHLANLIAMKQHDKIIAVSEFHKYSSLNISGVGVTIVNDYENALNMCDAIVIANPSSLHFNYLKQAIAANKHVYIEKPVSPDSSGIAGLIVEAEKKKLVVAVGTQFRFNSALLWVKKILKEGGLGRVMTVLAYSGEHIADYHPGEDYKTSYAACRELGGGVLLTQIHQIDYLNWLFGDFSTVFANELPMPELEIDVECNVTYLLKNYKGLSVVGHVNYSQRPRNTGMEIIGTSGRLVWSYEANSVNWYKADNAAMEIWQEPFDRNTMFIRCMEDFLESISSGGQPRSTLATGLASLRLVETIKKSLENNTIENVH